MDSKEHQQQLYDYVRKLMDRDRAKHNVLPLSKFGLMQITRQRVRPAVEVEVMETCPTCMGKGKIQPSILFTDQIMEACSHMEQHHGRGLTLHLHPYVYAYVSRGWLLSLKAKWQRKYGVKIVENQSLGMLEMRFLDVNGKPIAHTPEQPKKEAKGERVEAKVEPTPEPKPVEQPKPAKKKTKKAKKAVPAPQVQPTPAEQPKPEAPKKKKPVRRKKKPADKPAENAEK